MNELTKTTSIVLPPPRCEVSIRPAVAGDYAFIDRLQDMHTKMLGFMPKSQLEGKIAAGHVLIAEDETRLPIGYVMSQDRYFKRDDVGIIYQLNIAPGKQRSLVGATLIKAVFDRAAYGCRLFCCWCAQDLNANYFWEALGFVPLAFRAGAKGKRAHIFWQKRIREGDVSTPYWYPCKTDGGQMREQRIVLPIPPGVHWSDAKPLILPTAGVPFAGVPSETLALAGPAKAPKRVRGLDPSKGPIKAVAGQFGPPGKSKPATESTKQKPSRASKPKAKFDPKYLAAARDLRDKHLELFNAGTVLPAGKYDVSRAITDGQRPRLPDLTPLLANAA